MSSGLGAQVSIRGDQGIRAERIITAGRGMVAL